MFVENEVIVKKIMFRIYYDRAMIIVLELFLFIIKETGSLRDW